MDIIQTIRKLAKTNYYQSLYAHSKETSIRLFNNEVDFSKNQLLFLQYLSFYSNINMDIYMNEVDKVVLEDEVYEDAYSVYKNKEKDKKDKDSKERQVKEPPKDTKPAGRGFSWVMKK